MAGMVGSRQSEAHGSIYVYRRVHRGTIIRISRALGSNDYQLGNARNLKLDHQFEILCQWIALAMDSP